MAGIGRERRYSPGEGFQIYWDFILSLPKRVVKSSITYGVFAKGETLVSPKVVSDHLCEPETWNTNKCLFLESDFLYDI